MGKTDRYKKSTEKNPSPSIRILLYCIYIVPIYDGLEMTGEKLSFYVFISILPILFFILFLFCGRCHFLSQVQHHFLCFKFISSFLSFNVFIFFQSFHIIFTLSFLSSFLFNYLSSFPFFPICFENVTHFKKVVFVSF